MIRVLAVVAALVLFVFANQSAFAQDVISAQPTGPAPVASATMEDITGIALQSAIIAFLAAITTSFPWLVPIFARFLATRADVNQTVSAVEWERYEKDAMAMAQRFAQKMTGLAPEKLETAKQKARFTGWMLEYLELHHHDIVAEVDKGDHGIEDIIETHLVGVVPDKIFPGDVVVEDEKPVARRKVAPAADPTIAKFAPIKGGPH